MLIGAFLFRLCRCVFLEEQEFRTVKANPCCAKILHLVRLGREFDVRVQHNVLAVARHRLQLAHRKKLTALAFENFLAFTELADIVVIRIDDDLAVRTIDDNRIAVLHERSDIAKTAHRRNLQRPRQNGHVACTATRIHYDGVHLSRLERHQKTRNKFMRNKDNALFVSHVLQYRSGVIHGRHQAVVQVPQVRRLVMHGRGIDFLELFDVGAKNYMDRPLRILTFFLDLVENSIDESRILQDHQVGRKNQAVLDASPALRNFLYLGDFFRRLGDGLQEHLLFSSEPALRESLLDYRKLAVCNREHRSHGKTRRRRNTNKYRPRRFPRRPVSSFLRIFSRVLR